MKSILTGPKSKTLHKEELGVSEVERRVKRRVEESARHQQRKKSAMAEKQAEGGSRGKPSGKRSPVSHIIVVDRALECCLCLCVRALPHSLPLPLPLPVPLPLPLPLPLPVACSGLPEESIPPPTHPIPISHFPPFWKTYLQED